jgi:predicted dehydrogenase
MKKTRIGLIGCGIAAQDLHYPALKNLGPRFEVTWLCNRSIGKARALQKKYGRGQITRDYRDVLKSPDVDAVVVALPIQLNARVSIEALSAGKHVLCEKPMAKDPAQARRVVRAALASSKIYMVAENFAYDCFYQKASSLLRSGRAGKIFFASDTVFWKHNDDNKYTATAWRRVPPYLGGYFLDGGVHFMNHCLSLLGPAQSVAGTAFNRDIQKRHDNAAAMTFAMKSGALLQFNLVMSPVERSERCLRLFGTRANLELANDALFMTLPGKKRKKVPVRYTNSFRNQFLAFHHAVTTGRRPFMDAARGFRDLATLHAGLTAAVTGKRKEISWKI